MRVRAVANQWTPEQRDRQGASNGYRQTFAVTTGKEYLVLGLTFMVKSEPYGAGTTLEIISDEHRLATVPLAMFEIVDGRPSRHWTARKMQDNLLLWPESFHRDYYHDDLTEGVRDAVADFERVVSVLENEFEATTENVPNPRCSVPDT